MNENELEKRRLQRQQRSQQRAAQQKKLKLRLLLAAVFLIFSCIIIAVVAQKARPSADPHAASVTRPPETAAPTVPGRTEPPTSKTVIHLAAVGDLNVTDKTVASGSTASGGYDYSRVFMDVAPLLTEADLAMMNFEGNLCGMPYGSATVSAPDEMIAAMANIGVDLVQMANSRSINNGLSGLADTLGRIRNVGLEPLGAWESPEAFRESGGYTIREVQGVRIAFVAFTKGMDNMSLPAGGEACINLLYKDYATTYQKVDTEGITTVLRAAEARKPDLTVALLHWGSEYNDQISDTQDDIRDLMISEGVDVIIGSHPHYVQQMVLDPETRSFTAYSLGDFFSDAEKAGSNYSVVLNLEITKDNVTGITSVTDYRYDPIFTMKDGDKLQVVRLKDAMTAFESSYIQRISQEDYDDMTYALLRIEQRIHPDEDS